VERRGRKITVNKQKGGGGGKGKKTIYSALSREKGTAQGGEGEPEAGVHL